ncbi:Mak10 subunit, NatC N-terminal acetyltransferase-domain-containing protein [Sporodiniella umbellata]|nr:Mak10 subunit, NatC N-terminal acetyltransferase-domain-containing protein [Sporodiniella umbellata]
MDTPQDLQEILSKLNINVPKDNDETGVFLPQWKDITSFLDEATNDFQVGQLLSLKSFTLYEAMSAIELMNPRMDTGVPAEALVPNIDISKQLSTEEVLSVMDSLVAREIAWLSGHSLSQTVYTCVYFHHLSTLNETPNSGFSLENAPAIANNALKTYLNATLSCCRFIWNEMIQGNIYEEEDFTTNLFGLTLDNPLPDNRILDDLDISIKNIAILVDKQVISAAGHSIINRLKIRKSFLLALTHLSQNEPQCLAHAKIELDSINSLLKQTDATSDEDVEGVFDPNINRNLTSQTPPRPVELETKRKSYLILSQIISRLLSICDVVDYTSAISLMNFFDVFGAETPHADAFSRSKLNTILYSNSKVFGIHDIPSLILKSIEEMIKPPSYWLSTCHKKQLPPNTDIEQFLKGHESLKLFLDRISMVCMVEVSKPSTIAIKPQRE